jgi:putative tryptophan/tyrosine transport system substrate-binding protein
MKTAITLRALGCIRCHIRRCSAPGGAVNGEYRKLLIAAFAVCAMTAGLATAQNREAMPTIGVLWVSDASRAALYLQPFKDELGRLGWIDGATVRIIERYDNGDSSRLLGLAKELVALPVDVLYVTDGAVPAASQATTKIPIVGADFYDPIAQGITSSMARPDRNITGVSWQSVDSAVKRLQMAQELIPGLRRVGLLFDASESGPLLEVQGLVAAAASTGIDLRRVEVRGPGDFQRAFAQLKSERLNALLVSVSAVTWQARDRIGRFAAQARLPLIAELPEFAEAGAVLSYGADIFETYRRGAHLVDRILKGAKASDLPFEQPKKFELVVNLRTARTLRLTIPESVVARAAKVIR